MESSLDPQQRQEGRRPRNVVLFDLAAGTVLLLITLGLLFSAWAAFREIIKLAGMSGWLGEDTAAAVQSGGNDAYLRAAHLIALCVFVLFFLGGFLRMIQFGFARLIGAAVELTRPTLANEKRPGLGEGGEICEMFRNGNIPHYREINPFLNSLFGRLTLYLAPVERRVVTMLGEDLRRRVKRFVIATILILGLYAFVRWLASPSSGGILGESGEIPWFDVLRESAAAQSAFLPFLALLVLSALIAFANYLILSRLMPAEVPQVKTIYRGDDIRGFGHPQQLHVRLPRIVECKQLDDHRPNVTWSPPLLETASASIKDAGTFVSQALIERHPEPLLPGGGQRGAWLLLVLGWLAAISGTALMLGYLLPGAVKRLAAPDSAPPLLWLPLYILGASLATGALFKASRTWLAHAQSVFLSIRYRSVLLFAEFRGQITVSEVRVGKAIHDSLESSRRVVSSDFTARYYAAEVVSQSTGRGGERVLLELRGTPLAQEWLDHIHEEVRAIGCEPVRITGIDTDVQAGAMVEANIRIAHARKNIAAPAASGGPPPIGMQATPLLPENEESPALPAPPSGDSRAGYRECPSCAEWVREKARVCRYCQTELADAAPEA